MPEGGLARRGDLFGGRGIVTLLGLRYLRLGHLGAEHLLAAAEQDHA